MKPHHFFPDPRTVRSGGPLTSCSPRMEAHALWNLVSCGRQTIEEIRELIAIEPEAAEQLRRYVRLHPEEAGYISQIIRYRERVGEEFERLIRLSAGEGS